MPVLVSDVSRELCKALGVNNEGITSITVSFNAGEFVTATVVMAPTTEQVRQVIAIIPQSKPTGDSATWPPPYATKSPRP